MFCLPARKRDGRSVICAPKVLSLAAVNELKIIIFVLNYLSSLSATLLTVGSKIFPMLFITGHIPQVPKIKTVFLYEYNHDTIALQIHKEPTNPRPVTGRYGT